MHGDTTEMQTFGPLPEDTGGRMRTIYTITVNGERVDCELAVGGQYYIGLQPAWKGEQFAVGNYHLLHTSVEVGNGAITEAGPQAWARRVELGCEMIDHGR